MALNSRSVEGGKLSGARLREKARKDREEYNKNPNLCKQCLSPILCKAVPY